ncbi:MAG: nucleotidyltransferase family protein [Sterolibacterium sp.]|nr:nucleotidyltransferase family protein [Sterolibacterium sp.]
MKAMLLAAGRGNRMRPLSDRLPKPLLPVAGKPLIVWQIERLAAAGITELVINHAHLGEYLLAALGDGRQWGVSIQWSAEQEALETAGGIRQALPLLGDAPFLVVSSDIYCDCDYRQLLAQARLAPEADALMWMVANPAWHPDGDFALVDGYLQLAGEPRLTYANFGMFRPQMFARLAANQKLPLRPLLDQLIPQGRIQGARLDALWENLGTPEQLAALDRRLTPSPAQP